MPHIDGGCACGRVRYRINVPPSELKIVICHCRQCARQAGSYIMSLVNTSVDEQDIVLKRNGIRVDAENITGEEGTLFDGVLPSLEVRLVKVQTSQ